MNIRLLTSKKLSITSFHRIFQKELMHATCLQDGNPDLFKWTNRNFIFYPIQEAADLINITNQPMNDIIKQKNNSKRYQNKVSKFKLAYALLWGFKLKPKQVKIQTGLNDKVIQKIKYQIKIKKFHIESFFKNKQQNDKLLTANHINYLQQIMQQHQNKKITLKEIKSLLLNRFPSMTRISLPSLSKILRKKLGMSYKRASTRMTPVLTQNYKDIKLEYCKTFIALRFLNFYMIYIDEYSINESRLDKYTWCKKGLQCYLVQQYRRKSFTMIAAISNEGLLLLKIQKQTNKSQNFCKFLVMLKSQIIKNTMIKYHQCILIFDNATIHKAKNVRKTLQDLKMKAITVCPHTPELNPCELQNNKENKSKLLSYKLIEEEAYKQQKDCYNQYETKSINLSHRFLLDCFQEQSHFFH